MSGFYSEYRGQCIGRLMYWLYKMSNRSDQWEFDHQYIYHYGKKIGKYRWFMNSDLPVFKFFDVKIDKTYREQHRYNIKMELQKQLRFKK